MTRIFCDKCERELRQNDYMSAKIYKIPEAGLYREYPVTLCEACWNDFKEWLGEEEETDGS